MQRAMGVSPRIGIMAVGLGAYWPQFQGMREQVLGAHARLSALFAGRGEVVAAGLVDSVATARGAGELFEREGVDIVFCHLTTYANSETLLPAVRRLDVPVILLNVQPVRALDMSKVRGIADWLGVAVTPSSLPEMTNGLIRIGKRFDTITGHLEDDSYLYEKLALWCRIAGLTRTLKTRSMALLGRPYAGMMDLSLDETNIFARTGTFIRHLDWDDVIAEMDNATEAERNVSFRDLRATFPASDSLTESEFNAAAVVLAAMRRFVARYQLCAIASHYEGQARGKRAELLAALNPALSVLMAEGVACPVEADMKVALAMLILKTLAGSATLAELYSMDFDDDLVIIGHSGAGDPAISGRSPSLSMSEVFHGKSGRGYLTQFYPKAGDVTLLSLTQDARGGYRMVAAEGTIVEGPTLNLGDTNSRVRFADGLRRFVHRWSSFGPTHHGVLGHGHQIEALRSVSTALDLPLDVASG